MLMIFSYQICKTISLNHLMTSMLILLGQGMSSAPLKWIVKVCVLYAKSVLWVCDQCGGHYNARIHESYLNQS